MAKKKYTTNQQILDELVEYHRTGIIQETLHIILYDMSIRIGYKSNFVNYTFKDDMISDAYMKCLKAVKSFNPEKANAFAYFTTVIHNSFLTSISRSKYQIEMKEKIKDRLYDELAQRYGNLIDVRSLVDDEMEQ